MAVRRQPTLRDIAAAAGVAVSTASRALTRPGRVNADTAERVMAVAKELGYIPSASARALLSGRTSTVALVLPDVTNPVFFGLVRGTSARLRESGYVQVLADTEESVEVEADTLRKLRGQVDGAVLAASRLTDEQIAAAAADLALVVVNRTIPGTPGVLLDTAGGMVQAIEHLAALGHTRIAYAGGPATSWSDRRRREALVPAAERLGVELVVHGPYSPVRDSGPAAADAALAAGVTAVMAFNDLLAFGILERLDALGVDVPGRMSVTGCDDIFGSDLVRPALTTVRSPVERAGRMAADLLLARLDGDGNGAHDADGDAQDDADAEGAVTAEPVLMPTDLVQRASTGRPTA
ncbi:LacI family DNA-binding transcriptional regulator [Cellulomonas iranensis]|uniref:LacI family transcriptional regulator/LacI family repressor for deo operon, udp, cdd, tsx, nupC, and nupG n=1 Tax=Cellulomonas iranensis TaxID=76862 RepID=A0ABU0GME5_9CELL|nr:LacI family DNA-binding transcriptional regulator [Cellulomonas iranensis]MDQ0425901.1 LacI family transcriptional regulator/LacI family repressor for deo operon, udp, cdd, tsx, nupC, and nupG [Cellulomonas iranensis]